MKYWAIFFLFIIYSFSVEAQHTKASITCLETLDDGSMVINWSKASDKGFQKYQIFKIDKVSPAPKEILSTSNVSDLSFVYKEAYADYESSRYFIKTVFSDQINSSDTVSNIYLSLSKKGALGEIKWNKPYKEKSGKFKFDLYKGLMTNLKFYKSTSDIILSETGFDCSSPDYYQVKVMSDLGCEYISNKVCVACFCNDYTFPPIIDSVSVKEGKVQLGWEPSQQKKVVRYFIFRKVGNKNIIIHINEGINNTFFEDDQVDPCSSSFEYSVSAVDSCGLPSPYSTFQHNLLIKDMKFDPCTKSVEFSWNNYLNANYNINAYEVWGGEILQKPFIMAKNKATKTKIRIEGLKVNSNYKFFIRLKGDKFSSTSCPAEIKTPDYNRPDTLALFQATVNEEQIAEIRMRSDRNVKIEGYNIFRSDSKDGLFENIGFVNYDGKIPSVFQDHNAETQKQNYFYKVQIIDECGLERQESQVLQTELLRGESVDDAINQLFWSVYDTYKGGVKEYRIYRSKGAGFFPNTLLSVVSSGSADYKDNIASIIGTDGFYNYRIEVIPNDLKNYKSSFSNLFVLRGTPDVFIPNAFNPNGVNKEFRPVGKDLNPEGYKMIIFNRWGQIIFESNSPFKGWNGQVNGSLAEPDTYVYQIIFQNLDGSKFEKKGILMLVR
ncbi:MAG: gliding motility-associated C-terminal domain-containing protein [Bacteroidales bacterium]